MTADQAGELPGGQLCSLINLRETAWAQIRSGEANQKYSRHQDPQLSLLLPISGPTPVLPRFCQPCHAGRRHVIVIAGLAGRFPSGRLLFRER